MRMLGKSGFTAFLLTTLLLGLSAACRAEDLALQINGQAVTGDYVVHAPGVYEITGAVQDAQLRIQAPEGARVTLVLRDAQMNCGRGAAIYAQSGDVTIDLDAGISRISGGSEAEPAAIYAMDDLDIQGDAQLQVEGTYRNGIECRDDLTIRSGKIQVSAAWDGIRGRDHLSILGGEIGIDAKNDGLKANNDKDPGMGNILVSGGHIRIMAKDDAMHAEGLAEVTGGELLIKCCFEGIEGSGVQIAGGEIHITAQDDGLNATGEQEAVRITGGETWIDASGDGIDSAGALVLRGGMLVVSGTTSPRNSALDYLVTSRAEGSVLFASGSAAMAQAPKAIDDKSTLRIYFDALQSAKEPVSLCDEQGNLLLAYHPAKDYQALVLAHPMLEQGRTVALYQGGSIEGLQRGGAVASGELRDAKILCTVVLSGVLTSIDERGEPCDFVANSFGW